MITNALMQQEQTDYAITHVLMGTYLSKHTISASFGMDDETYVEFLAALDEMGSKGHE